MKSVTDVVLMVVLIRAGSCVIDMVVVVAVGEPIWGHWVGWMSSSSVECFLKEWLNPKEAHPALIGL